MREPTLFLSRTRKNVMIPTKIKALRKLKTLAPILSVPLVILVA